MRLFATILEHVWGDKKPKKKTTLVGIEISEKKKKHEYTTDLITFNKEGGVPKGHPFIDREWKGALKVTKDSIETPIDLTKDMSKEELTEYIEREWNGEKYKAGKESYKDAEKKWRKKDTLELLEEIDPHYSESYETNVYGDDDWANPE